jgi:hypothetical protein
MPEAARDGVVCLELKSWPCSTKTNNTARTPIASSHPQMNAIARRRPDDMPSKTITVTTEPGLVKATASPRPAISGVSVPTAPPRPT